VLVAALGGVLLSGFVAAIPVLTRGLLFSAGNVQLGLAKNWGLVPPITGAVWLSLALFVGVFCLSLLGPRFWCRHVCPSGALLSLPSWLRLSKRQTSNRCTACGNCIAVCPFDAIEPDFSTRMLNCTFCQTCGGICPTGAIRPLSLADKRRFVIGLAVVDTALCLPHRGERDCQFCLDECNAAGYRAIEMRPIKLATGSVPEGAFSPDEIEQMGRILAPYVKADACVGCGLCEYRCHSAWVGQQKLLPRSAVIVKARA
jgi:ferredoxin